jgi:LPXTG-motif cell wall-anchored protein
VGDAAGGPAGDNQGMWLMIVGAAAAAAFWLFVFDRLERRKSR